MARSVIKKSITTEKSYANQDAGMWTFLVANDSNKIEIKHAIEQLFGVVVAKVTTTAVKMKQRMLKRGRYHTKRPAGKIARITLKDKTKKIDLTKLNK